MMADLVEVEVAGRPSGAGADAGVAAAAADLSPNVDNGFPKIYT